MTPADARALYASRRARGLCVGCGLTRVFAGTRCAECREVTRGKRWPGARVTTETLHELAACCSTPAAVDGAAPQP